jgi:AraC-like DNA-binding protein/tetratricopeptide (TPR) repeat protein
LHELQIRFRSVIGGAAGQQAKVQEAIGLLRESFRESLPIRNLARRVGLSHGHLDALFREATGESPGSFRIRLRIERGQELLRNTDLPVTEIAYESGFRNTAYFSRAFRRLAGCPPSSYRRHAREGRIAFPSAPEDRAVAPREVLSEDFHRPELAPRWRPLHGTWRVERGGLTGRSGEETRIALGDALPENARVELRISVRGVGGKPPSDLILLLADARFSRPCYAIVLGGEGNTHGSIMRGDVTNVRSREAVLAADREMRIAIELRDDRVRVEIDGREVLSYRDPFPPVYALRSHLVLRGWLLDLRVHALRVFDLGLPPVVPAVRLGDTLYNEGLHERAIDFYLRELQREDDPERASELRYKIGAVHLRTGRLDQAEAWLRKLTAAPALGFWSERAGLALVRLLAERGETRAAIEEACKTAASRPDLSDEAANAARESADDLTERGRFDESARLLHAAARIVEPGSNLWRDLLRNTADVELSAGRTDESAATARRLLEGATGATFWEVGALHQILTCQLVRGDLKRAGETYRRLETAAPDVWSEARAANDRAALARARGAIEEAVTLYDRMAERFAGIPQVVGRALLEAGTLLCAAGKLREGKQKVRLAYRKYGRNLRPAELLRRLYVPPALEGDFRHAYAILNRSGRRVEGVRLQESAVLFIAGMLALLSGDAAGARRAWRRASDLFPSARCRGVAEAAARFSRGELSAAVVDVLPYDYMGSSELFYWIGRVLEARGRTKAARACMRACAEKDRSLRWPALLARR